jgi:solute carrier family 13 (sodium-dependent dicarboxylate transporter), member 2/3/5
MKKLIHRKTIGLLLGICCFIIILLLPVSAGMTISVKRTAACAVLMAVWWITEAIPIPATALLPLVLYPLLKILNAGEVALAYADKNIFLFMGGFFIAMAMQKHNLHKRIALFIIYLLGTSSRKLILGFMIATAFLSMWISNTATAMMMLPIALAVLSHVESLYAEKGIQTDKHNFPFAIALMLGIAYAASIGGVGTLVGTPPNIIFAGMVKKILPGTGEIGFLQWMSVGIPVVLVFLPVTWLYLVYIGAPPKVNKIPGGKKMIYEELRAMGKMSTGERITLIVFILTALGWIFKSNIHIGSFTIPGWVSALHMEKYIHDSTIAMVGGLVLFILPTNLKKKEFALDWEWAKKIPWGILILFGGGFALASSFETSGLDQWIGSLLGNLNNVSIFLLIICTCLLMTFLTEVTSNTATIAMMLPVLAALAASMNINPFILMVPATFSTSFAFMMPVATPPNAIVFGSEYLKIHQMARIGIVLNLLGVVIITALMYLVVIHVFNIVM